jgi:hypothetical protein
MLKKLQLKEKDALDAGKKNLLNYFLSHFSKNGKHFLSIIVEG